MKSYNGEQIKKIREKKLKLTRSELGRLLGYSGKRPDLTVRSLEIDRHKLSGATLKVFNDLVKKDLDK